jgi:TctA family transporter
MHRQYVDIIYLYIIPIGLIRLIQKLQKRRKTKDERQKVQNIIKIVYTKSQIKKLANACLLASG